MTIRLRPVAVAAALSILAVAAARAEPARHRRHIAAGDRPLTIGGHPHRGIYRDGDRIVAPGGFSAQGYGYPAATPEERRDLADAELRARGGGPYGYGVDGLGGWDDGDGIETGYDNPFYGNAFNRYGGYGGVPSDLAFGPAFANRHIAGHDPVDDPAIPGPSPGDLGYGAEPGDD